MLLFTEGFDWTNVMANYTIYGKWMDANGGSINTGSPRFVTGSGNYTDNSLTTNFLRRAIGQNLASGVIGFGFRVNFNAGGYKNNIFVLHDGLTSVQLGLLLNNDLTVSIFRGTHANILGTTTASLVANAWTYIELKWKIADSIASGDVVLYFDATSVLSLAAAVDTKETANAYATHYAFRGVLPAVTSGINATFHYDDHYLLDLTGSAPCNAPLGNVRIITQFPNGDGSSSQWVGSDGNSTNNSLLIDETALSTADYVESATVSNKDTYAFSDTLSTTTTIFGVTINLVATKTDADPRTIKPVVRHSSTDYDGSALTLTTAYLNYQSIYEQNPGTSSGWTKSDVDAAQFGVKVDT